MAVTHVIGLITLDTVIDIRCTRPTYAHDCHVISEFVLMFVLTFVHMFVLMFVLMMESQ